VLYVLHDKHRQKQSGVPKEFLAVGGGVLAILFIVFGVGIAHLTTVVGFAYPAFKSFESIETKFKGDDTQWLVYWVIFALFNIVEVFADILLYWIPFFYSFKLAFLCTSTLSSIA
jgi:receptor expression-enhancing protein 5/6